MGAVSSLPATSWGSTPVSPIMPPASPEGSQGLPPDLQIPPKDVFTPTAAPAQKQNQPSAQPVNPEPTGSPFILPPSSIASMPPNLGYYNPADPTDQQQQQNSNPPPGTPGMDYTSYFHEGVHHFTNIPDAGTAATQILSNIHHF